MGGVRTLHDRSRTRFRIRSPRDASSSAFGRLNSTSWWSGCEWIAKQEGIEADQEALAVIAQAGEGSVRDSLSALDQAIACCGKTLSVAEVRALLGMFSLDSLQAVAGSGARAGREQMLEMVQELERNGRSLQHFCRELARYLRNLLVAKIAGKPTRLIAASDREQTSDGWIAR